MQPTFEHLGVSVHARLPSSGVPVVVYRSLLRARAPAACASCHQPMPPGSYATTRFGHGFVCTACQPIHPAYVEPHTTSDRVRRLRRTVGRVLTPSTVPVPGCDLCAYEALTRPAPIPLALRADALRCGPSPHVSPPPAWTVIA